MLINKKDVKKDNWIPRFERIATCHLCCRLGPFFPCSICNADGSQRMSGLIVMCLKNLSFRKVQKAWFFFRIPKVT